MRGTLRIQGGPSPGVDKGTPGRIRVLTAAAGAVVTTAKMSASGSFVLRVREGTSLLKGSANSDRQYGYTCVGPTVHGSTAQSPNVVVSCGIG